MGRLRRLSCQSCIGKNAMSDTEDMEQAVSLQPVPSGPPDEVACYELSVTRNQASKCQWCCCGLICLMGGFVFGLIPCCCHKYSHIQHRCPICNYTIAVAKYQDTTQK